MDDTSKLMQVDEGSIFPQTSEKFEDFRQGSCLCDVKIVSADGREHNAHRVIMSARSQYFQRMFFSNAFVESKEGIVKLEESSELVEELIRYIYTGKIRVNGNNAQDLLRASSQYQLPQLFNFLDLHISEHIDLENCTVLWGVARKLNAEKLLEKLPPFIEKNFGKIRNIENMEGDLIVKISKSEVVPAELFLFQLKCWFLKHKDVETVCQALKVMDFNALSSESLLEMENFFGELECMKILYRRVTERLSSNTLLNLMLSLSVIVKFKMVYGTVAEKTFLTRNPKDLEFTLVKILNGFTITQLSGMKRPYLIRLRREGVAGGGYKVHDFSASNSCTLERESFSSLKDDSNFILSVYDIDSKSKFTQDQRIYEKELLHSKNVPVGSTTSGLFGFSLLVTTVGNRTLANVCSVEYNGLVILFIYSYDRKSYIQTRELDFYSSSKVTFELYLRKGEKHHVEVCPVKIQK